MNDHIDLRGGSGKLYRYRLTSQSRPNSAMSGTYVYVRDEGEGSELLFIGDADNLMIDARSRWDEAVNKHKATHLYIRLNISASTRKAEIEDILEDQKPVMNK